MDGDMNDIFQKLNSMLSDKEASENLKNILNNFSSSNSSSNADNTTTNNKNSASEFDNTQSNSENFSFNNSGANSREQKNNNSDNLNFDINTVLKIKSVMDAMNNGKNDSRSQLLLSLKPYLRSSKKDKVDQYIKMLNIASAMQVLNKTGGEGNKHE